MGPLPMYNETHTNNTGVLVEVEVKGQSHEGLIWALICALFSIVVFGVATIQYIRKRANSPKQRRKKKQRDEAKRKAREEKSITAVSRDPIPVEDLIDVLHKKRKKGSLVIEFKALTRLQADPACDAALLPANRKKNAYPEVLPFDHCRVTLDSLPGVPNSDYINASYIDAYNKPKAYIASQGPNRHTINDFWRMVWQENVRCIVMATNVFEHARQQCEKYWHNQHGRYGNIEVWLDSTDILADFNIRTFRVKRDGSTEERVIKQFQFANWSDHDCPNPSSVLEYRRRVRAYTRNKPGPLLVHCGSGAGRTGTYIGLDAMLDRLSTERNVDIFNYALFLRNSRMNMIRNLAQYEFIYDVVAMYLNCGTTVITAKELPGVVQKLAIKDPQIKLNGFEREYKTLQSVVPKLTVGECAGGHRAENRRKSRDIMLQPPERARPYLITHDSNDSTDYINAVYVDGYRHTNAYIVTQWPLKSTINDIWRLVYDYNIPTMVLLNDMPHSRSYPRFWPSTPGKEVPYGPLTIELESEQEEKSIISRVFRIRKHLKYKDIPTHLLEAGEVTTLVSLQAMSSQTEESARTVKMFQLRSWPNNHKVPSSATALIDMLTKVEKWQLEDCNGRIPTCVISKNGVTRCGCYTAISIAWDKLKAEGEVDIFRAVKTIKSNRPQLVENIVEYIYCYTFMVVLLDLLTTTQPHVIPRSESTDLERWEERSKPLVPVDHTRKGDDTQLAPQSLYVTPGLGRSHFVPSTPIPHPSMLQQHTLDWRADSIEKARSSGRSTSGVSAQLAAGGDVGTAAQSPPTCNDDNSQTLFSYPLYYYVKDTSLSDSTNDDKYRGQVVLRHKPRPTATEAVLSPSTSASQLHDTDPTLLRAADGSLPLRHLDLDFSFENEAYMSEISIEDSSEPYATPCETPNIQRLSISTDVSFHTARDEVTGSETTSYTSSPSKHPVMQEEGHTDMSYLPQPLHVPVRHRDASSASSMRRTNQLYKRSSAPVYSPTDRLADDNNGGFNRRATYHESVLPQGSGSSHRQSISELTSRASLAELCKEIYGDQVDLQSQCSQSRSVHHIPPTVRSEAHRQGANGTIGGQQSGLLRKQQRSSSSERGSNCNAFHSHLRSFLPISENVQTQDTSFQRQNRSRVLYGTRQSDNQSTYRVAKGDKLTQHGQIYHSAELYPLTDLPDPGASPHLPHLEAQSVENYHNYLTYSKGSGSNIWSVPTVPSDTIYRVPELKLGKSTYV